MKQAVPLNRYLVFSLLTVGVCAADLAAKTWMFNCLGMPHEGRLWWLWDGIFRFGFQTSLNEGALGGIGQGFWMVFSILAIAAAIGILVWLFVSGAAHDWLLTVAMGLVMAGILGNLYDRLGFPGLVWSRHYPGHQPGTPVHAVRDYVLMTVGDWHWPNYNIADSALVCGAALLVWHALFMKVDEEGNTKAAEQ